MWCVFVIVFGLFLTCGYSYPKQRQIVPYDYVDYPSDTTDAPVLQDESTTSGSQSISFGSCKFVINGQCPDPDVTFYMYSSTHPDNPEQIQVGRDTISSNLRKTAFDPNKPSKLIIHGFSTDMFLNALTELRKEYLKSNDYNIFTVDWSPLNQAPCYPAAVWNCKHVGTCTAQLIERLRNMGATDIHVIGFSLGAQILNYIALALKPYKLPRVTGLDPAFPGFATPNKNKKLDKSDGEFVDVYHTNAFMQGKAEPSGHVDFYMNGGIVQPGCWANITNFFTCNHQRAPIYFAESINSVKGFWGRSCPSYYTYLVGECRPQEPEVLMGEYIDKNVTGIYLAYTNSFSPYAIGKTTDISTRLVGNKLDIFKKFNDEILVVKGLEEDELIEQMYRKREKLYRNDSVSIEIQNNIADDVFSLLDYT